MRLSTRLFVAAAVVLIAITTACGSDTTAPPGGGPTPGTLAQHFDTLSAQARASSVGDTNYNWRAEALADLEIPAAFGAAPTTVTVTTASGTEQWKGLAFEEVKNASGAASDSAIFIVAYRDSLVHTAVISIIDQNGARIRSILLANDTLAVTATSHTGAASLTSTGSACPATVAGLVNPVIATARQATCVSAVFQGSLTLGFPATNGVSSALTLLSFPTTSFAGERLFDPLSASVHARLHATLEHLLQESH